MKQVKFYTCPKCNSILTSTGNSEITCCGRTLQPLIAKTADNEHKVAITEIENEHYITFDHEMSKQHFISFVASVSYDRVLLVKLYPEQGSELRIPTLSRGKLYLGCNKHGLWVQNI